MGNRSVKELSLNGIVVGEYLGSDDPNEDQAAAVEALRAKGLLSQTSLPRAMLGQADSFAFVAIELHKRLASKGALERPLIVAPFVVNAAFSVELYLKTLQEVSGGARPGHKLVKLFDALPEALQLELQTQTTERAGTHREKPSTSLRAILEMLNEAFVRWRYVYETPRTGLVNMRHVMLAMDATRRVCVGSVNSMPAESGRAPPQ